MTPAEPVLSADNAAQPAETAVAASYGLKSNVLSPLEVLAQSISTIAPTASPAMTIPLVFALAGNATWLAYLLATVGVLLVGLCVSRFARYSASPGSLYIYASTLKPACGSITAWALLLAYVATGASVVGGFINYANVLLQALTGHQAPGSLLAVTSVVAATAIAYRDVKISAELMLWIEAVSVSLIAVVQAILLWKNGLHIHPAQLRLVGASSSGVRLGVVLALFSFVGFESATTLGAEAREPLRTIPRAVIQSAVLAGIFFIVCAYAEVLGFANAHQALGQNVAPCTTAAARVLMLMAHNGLAPQRLMQAHTRNATPGLAVIVVGTLTVLPAAILAARGVSGTNIYGWMGSLATYAFITVYGLVAIALPFFLQRQGRLSPPMVVVYVAATLAMALALVGTILPTPDPPYNWLPYVYLVYVSAGLGWYFLQRRRTTTQ